MNDKKIEFIICYSNEECIKKSMACINDLIVPDGYIIEISGVTEADNVTEAYNILMKESDAKYKVYLYENIYIINRNFLIDSIREFEADEKLGMLGILGESKENCSKYGIWDCGSILLCNEEREEIISEKNAVCGEHVEVLNGCILMTVIDMEWECPLNEKSGYFDVLHSRKLREAGYTLKVPYQSQPWCLYEAGKSIYERYDVYTTEMGCRFRLPCCESEEPLVSVILCVYNGAKFVSKTIDSILTQTYSNLQIIIIDDCSSDESAQIIQEYVRNDSRIEAYYLKQNMNVCFAANTAMKHCDGKYVASIGHDDIWKATKIQRQVDFMEVFDSVNVCFTTVDVINQFDEIINEREGRSILRLFAQSNRSRKEWMKQLFFGDNCLCAPSSMIRRSSLESDLYKTSLVQLQDYALWLKLICKGDIYVIQDRLIKYRWFVGDGKNLSNITKNKANRLWHEKMHLKERLLNEMDDEVFVEMFSDHLINKSINDREHILCEKAFILKKINNCRSYDYFMDLIDCDETREILEKDYHFSLSDFYEFNTTSMIFDTEQLYIIEEMKRIINGLSQECI